MHIADVSKGLLGANGIVAGGLPLALGAALSAERRGTDQVSVCFIGDGAMSQGVTFEVLNMAALWQLPLIVVCEDNLYGQYSPQRDTMAGNLIDRPKAFGIECRAVDGMDVTVVAAAMAELVAQVRARGGPRFFVVNTYRYGGHHVAEVKSDYRTAEEIKRWQQRDPITLYERRLLDDGTLDASRLSALHEEVRTTVARARTTGLAGATPAAAELLEDVYA